MKSPITSTIAAVRQNHALEHATMHVLRARYPTLHLAARSHARGFHVYGPVDTDVLRRAAEEALARLQAGQHNLAIHPFCGTNVAAFGLAATLFPLLTARHGSRSARASRGLLGVLAAILVAPVLGRLAQRHVTTSPDLHGRSITDVTRRQVLGLIIHYVEVS